MTSRYGKRRATLAGLALVLAVGGCGSSPQTGPRKGMSAFLRALAAGNVTNLCRDMSTAAVSELATNFRGSTCPATAGSMTRYVAHTAGEREAVATTVILPTLDVPLSPAPYRAGEKTTTLRLIIADPILRQDQAFDVTLRRNGGRWVVDGGVVAMFTLLTPPNAVVPRQPPPAKGST